MSTPNEHNINEELKTAIAIAITTVHKFPMLRTGQFERCCYTEAYRRHRIGSWRGGTGAIAKVTCA